MDNYELSAENAVTAQPQTNENAAAVQPHMSEEDAVTAQPQTRDVDSMTDADFDEYIEESKRGQVRTAAVTKETHDTEPEQEPEPQEPPAVFKSFDTQEEWQREINGIIERRLEKTRPKVKSFDEIEAMARALYDGDDPVASMIDDLKTQAAERRSMTVEELDRQTETERKARLYDEQQAQTQAQRRYNELLDKWRSESAELAKTVSGFDFEKALENREFYDRVVKGYSVADAYALTAAQNAPKPKPQRRPIAQNAAKPQNFAAPSVRVEDMTDEQFDKYIEKCEKG